MIGHRKRVIITGGLGYLGQRIAKHLIDKELYDVVITSRKGGTLPGELKKCRLVNVDLGNLSDVRKLINEDDIIIHLAAPNEIDAGNNVPLAFEGTVLPTHNLLTVASEKRIDTFFYFSTFHVYGKLTNSLVTEDTLPHPNHPYSIAHKAGEDFCLAFADRFNVKSVVFRLSNAIGTPVSPEINRWSLVVNDLCKQIVSTDKIVLKSYGSQLRDFVTIDRVCHAIDHFIGKTNDNIESGVYNLGGESILSIWEMAEIVQQRYEVVLGRKSSIVRSDLGKEDTVIPFTFSNEKLSDTGFQYPNDVQTAIDETLLFCKNQFALND